MVEIKTEGNCIICILKGVLDGTQAINVPATQVRNKKIQLLGENITSWNTEFVVALFNIFKKVCKYDPAARSEQSVYGSAH